MRIFITLISIMIIIGCGSSSEEGPHYIYMDEDENNSHEVNKDKPHESDSNNLSE